MRQPSLENPLDSSRKVLWVTGRLTSLRHSPGIKESESENRAINHIFGMNEAY